jgi:fatty-acyl-CoA synthase
VNLANCVRFWARWDPTRVHLRFDGQDTTWAELDERSNRLANGLAARGVGHGDRVAILSNNCTEYLELVPAVHKLGAILVPLNVRLAAAEVRYLVDHSGSRVVVVEPSLRPQLDEALGGLDPAVVAGVDVVELGADFDALRVDGDAGALDPVTPVMPDDVAFLCYTSGTTGLPKGAMLSHGNVWSMAVMRILALGLRRDDRVYLPVPLAFTGGIISMYEPTYVSGATLILDRAMDPRRAMEVIQDEQITVFAAVPVVWEMMVQHPDFTSFDLSSLRVAGSGGAPVPQALLTSLQAANIPMSQGYGLTEGSGMNTWLPPEDAASKLGSAGLSMMHSAVRVVDDELHDVAPGEVGELVVKGPDVMVGYWNDPAATEATVVDGWLRTGDLARQDDEGYVFIVDRAKDMLISGGLNVYPAEVERVIAGLPGVAEVAVIGVADERWGEVPAALVTPVPGATLDEREIYEACVAVLADYKRPKYVVVRDAPLPRGMSGKVLKRELRDDYMTLPEEATPLK